MTQNNTLPDAFKSATFKLTGWYLMMLMILSVIFSASIYQITNNEIQTRLEHFQTNIQSSPDFMQPRTRAVDMRMTEEGEAASNLLIELVYFNIVILVIGGFVSYFLARRSLLPLEKAHADQSRFTSDASHELRTPLAVMKAELEVALRDNNTTTDELKEVLSSSLEEVEKLTKLSEMLLNLSHMDNNGLKLTPVNLVSITRETIKSFKLPNNRIKFTATKLHSINGNEVALFDLIKILIDNAIQYSPPNSMIKILITSDKRFAKFAITNSGQGIDQDKLPHIFERFYRVDQSRTGGNKKGYGLGLSLAKNIIDLHDGEISVVCEPGKNTTFSFSIPLC